MRIAIVLLLAAISVAEEPLVVHEWGTFTTVQRADGTQVPGINTDDEPVPDFVHRHPPRLINDGRRVASRWAKSLPMLHPDVTMRMETPVIYFHLPEGAGPRRVDVTVDFGGGWHTEFYPRAAVRNPGIATVPRGEGVRHVIGRLEPEAVARLRWEDLTIGGTGELRRTDAEVWNAPRRVDAALVSTPGGESERFLFYRGVADLPAPVQVVQDPLADTFRLVAEDGLGIGACFLVDVRGDGTLAWRRFDGDADAEHALSFAETAYATDRREELRAAMRAALVADGLFRDEAVAMLDTWDASYFRHPGLRLFHLLPREWIDRTLPLAISTDAEIVRTMVGRVEIVDGRLRERLARFAAGPVEDFTIAALRNSSTGDRARLRRYEEIGRFRAALLLDRPDLAPLAEAMGIDYYRPPVSDGSGR